MCMFQDLNWIADLTMYPACPLPRHITALYMIAVMSSIALFSQSITIVGADILVYCDDPYEQVEVEFRDMPSRFGDSLPLQGLDGYLVYADPPLACEPVSLPPNEPNISKPWILLIARGECSYEKKVRNAQASHYSAVIVHNVNSSDLEPMGANNSSGIFIPSVFVSDHTGAFLRTKYQYNETQPCRHYILINDDMPFNINTHLLLPFATVVGICCVIMLTFMVLKCIQDRRRQRRHRLPASSLRQIPTSKFAKGHPYETCAICLEDYVEGEKLRLLPCSHAYHSKCIDPWLTRNRRVCPVCKRKVFARHEAPEPDSDSDSDVDDTTPLVRPGSQGTQGGTFDRPSGNPNSSAHTLPSLFGSSYSSIASSSTSSNAISSNEVAATSSPGNDLEASSSSCMVASNEQSRRTFVDGIKARLRRYANLPPDSSCGETSTGSANGSQGHNTGQLASHSYMSSGEHSINSQPIDLDFSDNHFDRGQGAERPAGNWGSHTALRGSRNEVDGHSLEGKCDDAEEAVPSTSPSSLPSVSVRSSGSPDSSPGIEHKPSMV